MATSDRGTRSGEATTSWDWSIWDHARPASPLFDVVYGLEYGVPFRGDAECVEWLGYAAPPDRRHRVEVFCDAYGIPVPSDVRVLVADQQRSTMSTVERLGRLGVEPQATWIREGYLATVASRIEWTYSLVL